MSNEYEALPKIISLLEGFRTGLFVTHGSSSGLHARPMAIASLGLDAQLKLLSDIESAKTFELERDDRSLVVFQNEGSVYLALEGRAQVSQDPAEIEAIWKEPFRVYFPDGKSDPQISVITFRPDRIEYWNSAGLGKLTYLWEAAKAYVTGTKVETRDAELHGVLHI